MKYRITGLSKHHFVEYVNHIKKGDRLYLFRDKENIYDKRATGVAIHDWITLSRNKDSQIGWIPKSANLELSALLDAGFKFEATVCEYEVNTPIWESNVSIDVTVKYVPDLYKGDRYITSGVGLEKYTIDMEKYIKYNGYKEQYEQTLCEGDWYQEMVADLIAEKQAIDEKLREEPAIQKLKAREQHGKDFYVSNNPWNEIFLGEPFKQEKTIMQKQVDNNKVAATSAAYLESGRIVLSQVTKVASAKAPLMVKGYIDTPFGKLVLANLLQMAQEQFRPQDVKLKKLSTAALTAAYQEVYQSFDIEKLLEDFLDNAAIKQVMQKED